jgi:glycosyltransferase involved in cell wall biosynthesis
MVAPAGAQLDEVHRAADLFNPSKVAIGLEHFFTTQWRIPIIAEMRRLERPGTPLARQLLAEGEMRRDERKRKRGSTREGIWLVLHLNPRKRGSQEQQLVALARRLRARGTAVTYLFSSLPPEWLARELDALGVRVGRLDFARPLFAAAALYARLQRARPALVHFHFVAASSPLVVAARLAGARVIVNDHITLTRAYDSALYEELKRLRDTAVGPLVALRLAVSPFVAESVVRFGHVAPGRIQIVENGVDVPRFARASGAGVKEELGVDGPLVVCVSRLAREKGVDVAVRAWPRVGRGAVLALVGDGPLARELVELAARLGVADRVRLVGLRDDVERLLAACDVSIVPSSWDEAFGQAVAESMAAGRAVVVTQSGAMPELVGDSGLVVPRHDPAALAAAIDRLLADDELRRRLGREAQARARRLYDLPRWVDRMVAVYDRVAGAAEAQVGRGTPPSRAAAAGRASG